ncbi:MAG: tetratricopeptide repeat protein, partial [Bacteroidaceae bacterium]|nr:tetratricopeptide repeat protein [Bacteroidaceae bacterium]
DRIGSVTITKKGMMIFNKQAVEEWSVRKEPLVIILCDVAEFENRKNNLIAIGEREAKKRYDKRLAEIEAQYKEESVEYYKKLDELHKELSAAKENMEKYADVFARIDESEIDTLAQQAVELFNAGEVERAIELFEQGNYIEKVKTANNTIDEAELLISTGNEAKSLAEEDFKRFLQNLKTQIEIYKEQNNWEKAKELLKSMADKVNNFETALEYATLCKELKDHNEAEIYYSRCLELAPNDDERAKILSNMAHIYSITKRQNESKNYYKQALDIYKRLTKENPQMYEQDINRITEKLQKLNDEREQAK